MSRYLRAEIIENSPLNKNHNLLILSTKDIPDSFVPGQFYMIGTNNSYDPLLKRPFSIFRYNPSFSKWGMGGFSGELQFLYRVKGRGTEKLRQMGKGTSLHLIGPLGNGYPLPPKNLTPVLIAGGIGIASLFPLAEKLQGKCHLFYGGKTKDELLMFDELKGTVKELIISTDDGSMGGKATVADALNEFLTWNLELGTWNFLLYACGPKAMLEAVSKIAAEKEIDGYISMEENMACGIGACLGCAVKTRNGYMRVCKEGPVFKIEEIVW